MDRAPPDWSWLPIGATFQQWCQDVLRWGVGPDDAAERQQSVTQQELIDHALVTPERLTATLDWLLEAIREQTAKGYVDEGGKVRNKSLIARRDLLAHMIKLLESE